MSARWVTGPPRPGGARGASGKKKVRKFTDHEHYADGPPVWAADHRERPRLTEEEEAARYAGRTYDDH